MVEQRKDNQNATNIFAGMFGGAGNGGFFAQILTLITSFFNGNGGFGSFFAGLFGGNRNNNNDATPSAAPATERNFLQRGADAVRSGVEKGGQLLGRGLDALKNLIGHHESGNDYNRVYGAGVKRMPLTDMTIDQVIAWQRQYVNDGSDSSAAGKYQIIRKTLVGLKAEMGLSGNEKFDVAMQDRMFNVLAERRGLSAYQAGRIDQATFMNNLSKEWASLPKDNSGLSYYHGDGLNKAHASVASMNRALQETRAPGSVQFAEAKRTGQTLESTPRITSALNQQASVQQQPAPETPRIVSAAAPTPRQVPLMSPSFAMS